MTYVHNAIRLTARDDLGVPEDLLDRYVDEATTRIYQAWASLGAPVPALTRWSLFPAQFTVRRQIEKLQSDQLSCMRLYEAHSWIPEGSWTFHDH
ncbi:MAG: hypothetical protein KC996_00820 [Phycisphaerales bacterium]|nr:hypothetical protein [Phycisphaerales bacterium]